VLFSVACTANWVEGAQGPEHSAGTHSHDGETEAHIHELEAAPQQEEFFMKGDLAEVQKDTTQQTHE
jgi:hypothetical protein